LTLGVGLRYVPELPVDGTQVLSTLADSSEVALHATRASAWEGGLSARYLVSPSFAVFGALGGRAAQEWQGFDVTAGRHGFWSIAGEYHDHETPWSVRLGLGHESEEGALESSAGVIGLGFGWSSESWALDLGVVRRTLEREDHPHSFDDRLLATATILF
jgi:hypothetical protein